MAQIQGERAPQGWMSELRQIDDHQPNPLDERIDHPSMRHEGKNGPRSFIPTKE